MGPTLGRQDPGGPHVGPTKIVTWGYVCLRLFVIGTIEYIVPKKI